MSINMGLKSPAPVAHFGVGRCVITPAAADVCSQHQVALQRLLDRHVMGDHGDVGADSLRMNQALGYAGDRVMSVYRFGADAVWVVTDAGHEVTTLLTPEDY